jgi:hypothetical protein
MPESLDDVGLTVIASLPCSIRTGIVKLVMFLSRSRKLFCHWSNRTPRATQTIVKQISHARFDGMSGDTGTAFSGSIVSGWYRKGSQHEI